MPLIILALLAALQAGESSANPIGVAVLVQPSDPARALALAKAGWTVQALADEAGCQSLRKAGDEAGVLGRTLWVGRWNGAIPLADQTADLVEGPAAIGAEAKRVLIPGIGAGKAGADTIKVTRPASWDGWSHWLHGPDNNPVSADTAFTLPARIAWLGRPFKTDRSAAGRVAADGRLFLATGMDALNQPTPGTCELTASSLHNGTLLWRRTLPKGVRTARASMLALGSDLLLLEGGAVLRLDGASGAEKGRFVIAEGRELKWMGHAAGALVLLAGPVDAPSKGLFGDAKLKAKDLEEGRLGHGDELICVDAASGAVRWKSKPPAPIDGRAVAIADGKVIYHAPRSRIAALDLATGAERWVQADAQVLAQAGGERQCDLTVGLEERPGLVAAGKVVLLALPDAKHLVTLSLADGSLLWQSKRSGGRSMHEAIIGDRVFTTSTDPGGILDAQGGKKLGQFSAGGCGIFTAANNLLFAQAGGPQFDLATGKGLPDWLLKTQCHVGGFVADGRAIYTPAACRCHVVFGGIALAPFPGLTSLPEAKDAKRLEAGKAGNDAAVPPQPGDWPTHRGDVRRSGFTAVAVPQLKQAWLAKPAHPFPSSSRGVHTDEKEWRCTPPVGLGDLVVVGASDGSVRAFHAASGAPRWTFWSEGPVLAAPTLADGRVYVGSADGSILCLAASDGSLRWRFRAAPIEQRIPVYGLLQSPWPVNSGVLVEGGTAYAVAGMPMSPPATVYALDAASGAPRWAQREDWNPGGGIALIGKRLWARSFFKPGVARRFDPATGASDPDAYVLGGMRGRELAQVAPNLVLYGGAEVYRDVGNLATGRGEGLAMHHLDGEGRPQLPGGEAFSASLVAPAGDGELVVVAGTRYSSGPGCLDLEGWDAAATIRETDTMSAASDLKKMPGWRLGQMPEGRSDAHYTKAPQRRWGPLPLAVRGLALAKDAVVALAADKVGRDQMKGPWKLLILDRGTGATRQSLELPGEPATDGLCLTRVGGVVVTLRDGGVVAFAP